MSTPGLITQVNDKDTFTREVLEASHTSLVVAKCGSPWCGPCKTLEPVYKDVEQWLMGYIQRDEDPPALLRSVDVSKAGMNEITSKYHIMGLPTFLFFKNGELVSRAMDLRTKKDIITKIISLTS